MATIVLPHHSDPHICTIIASSKICDTIRLIDQLLRGGNGFAINLFKFFHLKDFLELSCTSHTLNKIVLYYIQNKPVHDELTPVRDIENFMMLFPHASALRLAWKPDNHLVLKHNIFVGSKISCLNLCGVDFTKIPNFNPANFTNVETLTLEGCKINNVNFFSCMQNVQSLILSESSVQIDGIDCLRHLQSLTHLDIYDVNGLITPDCLEHLDGLVSFKAYYCADVTDDVIAVLIRSGNIKKLNISGCTNPRLTSASIPLLKRVPDLTVSDSNVEFETCDVCGRKRSIDMISYHLMHQCNMNCQQCNQTIEIYNEGRHLAIKCTQNYIECSDCHTMILRKNQRRHRSRCMNRLVTCNHCNDMEPYYKKDHCSHLQNYEENSFKHFKSLKQKISILCFDLQELQEEIVTMVYDARKGGLKIQKSETTAHHAYIHMERNIAKHVNKPLKKLYVQHNMLAQLLTMRQKHKTQIGLQIEDMCEQQRYEYEEYWRRVEHDELMREYRRGR
jgi:hypothetical protein